MQRKNNVFTIFFLICSIFFLLNIPNFTLKFKQVFCNLPYSFLATVNSPIKSCKNFLNRVFFSNEIIIENKKLLQENEQLKKYLVEYKEQEDENIRLKEILAFKQNIKQETLPAQIIGQDLTFWRKSIVINKGKNDGIVLDLPVVSSFGLVGRIVEVGKNVSRIMAITDIDFRISALIQSNREEGIIEGNGSDLCNLKFISKEAFVIKNDLVLSSGLGGVFPKGLIIGQVHSSEQDTKKLFKKIKIMPAVNFSKLEEVLILK